MKKWLETGISSLEEGSFYCEIDSNGNRVENSEEEYLLILDKKIKDIIERRIDIENVEVNALMLVRDIIYKYKECRKLFWHYGEVIGQKDELRNRVRDVYFHFIKQLEEVNKTGLNIDDKLFKLENSMINILIYWDLIYKNGDIEHISHYYDLIKRLNSSYSKSYIDDNLNDFPSFKTETLGRDWIDSGFIVFFDEENITKSASDFKKEMKALTFAFAFDENKSEKVCIDKEFNHLNLILEEYMKDNKYDMSIVYNEVARAFYNSSNIYDNKVKALDYINKAIEIAPNENQLYLNRALLYMEKYMHLETLNDVKKALEVSEKSKVIMREFEESTYSLMFGYKEENNKSLFNWVVEYDRLVDTNESHYIVGSFIYRLILSDSDNRGIIRNASEGTSKINKIISLNEQEKKFKCYMEKAKGYDQLNDEEIRAKSKSNYDKKQQILKKKMHVNIYNFNESVIDKLVRLEQKKHEINDCGYDYYDDYSEGPDWLGGTESEDAFWEH